MHTVVLLPRIYRFGPTPKPMPFMGSRSQILDLGAEELATLIHNNKGYLQRRRRRTDLILEALFPNASPHMHEDRALLDMVNKALWDAGYVAADRVYGSVFRWEFSPAWGFR